MTANVRGTMRKRGRWKFLSWLLPHSILVVFSAVILLPLLWLLRVALTDKSTAYKIPPEWGQASLDNFIEIFTGYPFFSYFLNSVTVALGATVLPVRLQWGLPTPLPANNPDALSLAPLRPVEQMLPPVILFVAALHLFLSTVGHQQHDSSPASPAAHDPQPALSLAAPCRLRAG